MSAPDHDDESPTKDDPGAEATAGVKSDPAARPSERPDAARDLRNAVSSLKSAAGALFGNVQPALKEVLDEADRVYQQAKASAKPAVSDMAEEATREVQQIGETAEPLARSVGGELHKFTEVMAEAVEGAVKGARGAVSAARGTSDAARVDQTDEGEPKPPRASDASGRDDD